MDLTTRFTELINEKYSFKGEYFVIGGAMQMTFLPGAGH